MSVVKPPEALHQILQKALEQDTADKGSTLPAALQRAGQQAVDRFHTLSLPGRKTENWRYSSLARLQSWMDRYKDKVAADTATSQPALSPPQSTADLLIIEVGDQGYTLPDAVAGVHFLPGAELDDRGRSDLEAALAESEAEHPFKVFNAASIKDALIIRVSGKTPPLWLRFRPSSHAISTARILIQLDESAELDLYESHEYAAGVLGVPVVHLDLARNSRLKHEAIHLGNADSGHIHYTGVSQAADSRYQLTSLMGGSALERHDLEVRLQGKGAETTLNAVSLLAENRHCDLHSSIDHEVPHCRSEESVRTIVNDKGHAVFNGRIHIHPDAQKSIAEMNNRNLLLSPHAEVDTKPELEIYADDVQCAHGATVGQLDPAAIHYCLSRGIDRQDAIRMLSQAFVQDILADSTESTSTSAVSGSDDGAPRWFAAVVADYFRGADPMRENQS